VIAVILSLVAPSSAAVKSPDVPTCKLVKGEAVIVSAVVDGETLTLGDGRTLKLAGVQAPRPGDGRAPAWPLAEEARDGLATLLAGQKLKLKYGRARSDRHGRVVAFLLPENGPSAQVRMVEAGLARVAPTRDARNCIDDLLAAERRARAVGRGIWADPFYAVRDAADATALERLEGSYQIVEGTVVDAVAIRGRMYLNFGDDWHKDFTVTVAPGDVKLFNAGPWAALMADISAIKGLRLRVRGAISRFNGPDITVTVPEQIELLGERKDAAHGGGERTGLASKRAR
jgi:endonuclease YncB( thermonuclease family)